MKKKRSFVRFLKIGLIIGCIGIVGFLYLYNWFATALRPVSEDRAKKLITIAPRTSAAAIAEILQDAGVIRNSFAFLQYSRLRGGTSSFKAGKYRISPSMTPSAIANMLRRGGADPNMVMVTIPEGWNLRQIGDSLVKRKIATTADDFLELVGPKSTVKLDGPLERPITGWEGYFFPDTYSVGKAESLQAVAQKMLNNFVDQFYVKHKSEVEASGHSLHEIVTIASMVEREAEVDLDRAKIAGVIENRLNRKMKLDIDATVLYALGHHKNRVYFKDLKIDSPYNTYRHKGLPPGPIASPGLPSLLSALHPEKSEYLFYVAGPNRLHIFTKSEKEHNAVVAKLRQEKKSQDKLQSGQENTIGN